jgi:hypothetical protein
MCEKYVDGGRGGSIHPHSATHNSAKKRGMNLVRGTRKHPLSTVPRTLAKSKWVQGDGCVWPRQDRTCGKGACVHNSGSACSGHHVSPSSRCMRLKHRRGNLLPSRLLPIAMHVCGQNVGAVVPRQCVGVGREWFGKSGGGGGSHHACRSRCSNQNSNAKHEEGTTRHPNLRPPPPPRVALPTDLPIFEVPRVTPRGQRTNARTPRLHTIRARQGPGVPWGWSGLVPRYPTMDTCGEPQPHAEGPQQVHSLECTWVQCMWGWPKEAT